MASIHASQIIVGTVGNIYEPRTVGKENRTVVDFSVAVTPRKRNLEGEWEDGETYWVNCTAWQRLAENIVATWKKGDRVFVYGRTEMKPGYTDKEGVERPGRPIVTADFAGHDNNFYPSTQNREKTGGGASTGPSRPAPQASRPAAKAPVAPAPANDDLDFDFMDDEPLDDVPF